MNELTKLFFREDCPEWVRWIAKDSDNRVYEYEPKPIKGVFSWLNYYSESRNTKYVCNVEDSTNWEESLTEAPRSADGLTPAQFKAKAKEDFSNVQIETCHGWGETYYTDIDTWIRQKCKYENFSRYRIKPEEETNNTKPKENSMKLKYKLWNIQNVVLFQVLEMDERFRNIEIRNSNMFKIAQNLAVCSVNIPDLKANYIYLRGIKKEADNIIASKSFASEEEAKKEIKKYHEMLGEWARNWKGFQVEEPKEVETEENVFII